VTLREYAVQLVRGIIVERLDIAFELSGAYEARTGWRVRQHPTNLRVVDHMRALGLVEAIGEESTPEARAAGRGFHLSAFGLMVRRELLERTRDGGE